MKTSNLQNVFSESLEDQYRRLNRKYEAQNKIMKHKEKVEKTNQKLLSLLKHSLCIVGMVLVYVFVF